MRSLAGNACGQVVQWFKNFKTILALGTLIFSGILVAIAAPADISRGVTWLQTQVLNTGILATESKTATPQQAQCETATTLLQLVGNNAQLAALMGAMQGAGNDKSTTESLACTQLLTQRLGQVASSDLLARRRLADGSYRAYADFNVGNALDTGWALEGQLRSLSSVDQAQLLAWLQGQQSSDGSFVVNGSPKLLSTAIVLRGLKGIASQNGAAAAIAKKAVAYLLSKRSANAGWLGDVASTAVVFEAVHPYTGNDPSIATAVNAYLVGQQQADGSWKSDPYLTAVALRALALTGTAPIDPTAALSTASLQGQVVQGATGEPLANVLINVFSAGTLVAATPVDSQGRYALTGLPTGLLNVVASLANYQTVTGAITLVAQDTALFSPAMFAVEQTPVPSSVGQTTLTGAQIFGKVTNAQSNIALAGVSVSLQTPGTTVVLTTGNDGSFDTRVAAGEVTITYALSGFSSQTQHTVVSDGAVINAGTIAMKAKVSGAQIFGKVTNAQGNTPLTGVSVSLQTPGTSTVVLTSGSDGGFDARVAAGEVTITYVLSGFSSQTQHALVTDGAVINAGTIAMKAKQLLSTMRGTVVDQDGIAITGAKLTVLGQTATSVTSAVGSYFLRDLSGLQFPVLLSAPNFVTRTYQVSTTEPTDIQQNFTLVAQSRTDPTTTAGYVIFTDFALSRSSASANTAVTAAAVITNPSTVTATTAIGLEVRSAQGAVVANLPALNDAGQPFPPSALLPGQSLPVQFKWDTAAFLAGDYTLVAKLVLPGSTSITNPLGTVTASVSLPLQILPSPAFTGSLTANPPVLRAGTNTPVRLSALVQNAGNVILPQQAYQLSIVDTKTGLQTYTQTVSGTQLPLSQLLPLQFTDWASPGAGSYRIELRSPSVPGSLITTSLFIGDAATASFTVSKQLVPTGNQIVRGSIKVAGVDVATGSISDPLAPLVKSAVVKSVNFVDSFVYNHSVSDLKCFACHVQSQAVVGGERNLRFAPPLEPLKRAALMDTLTRYVRENGSIVHDAGYYMTTNTSLGLWAAKEWHDQKSVAMTTRRMADYLVTQQQGNGSWSADYPYLWWANPAPFTALNMMSFADLKSSVAINGSPTTPVLKPSGIAGLPSDAAMRFSVDNQGRLYVATYFSQQIWTVPPGGVTATLLVSNVPVTSVRGLDDGSLLYSATNGIYKRAADGTTVQLSALNTWDVQPYGASEYLVSPNQQGKSMILGADGQLRDYFVSSLFGGFLTAQLQLPDGSILGNGYYGNSIVRYKDGQLLDVPVPVTNEKPIDLLKVGDDVLVSTENGLYKYNKEWVSERLTFERTYSMVKMPDGRILANLRSGLYEVALDAVDKNAYIQRLDTSIQRAGNWLVQGSGIDTNNNIDVAFRLMGLGKLKQYYKNTPRYAEFDALMQQLGTLLQSRQRPDGGWEWKVGQYNASDSMVTAMVGLGLDTLNPSKDDPIYRKTIVYLLGTQQADGSWPSQNGVAATKAATSTWVEIYLPTLLDRLGGIDTDLNVRFAPNAVMSNPSASPTSVVTNPDGSVDAKWRLIGVTAEGRQVDFDLALPDMQIDESRPAAQQASLEFRNSFVDGTVTAQIDIPRIQASSNASVSVTTNKPAYNETETAVFSAPVTNAGSFVRDAQVRLSVFDATGQLVEILPLGAPITVAAGASVPVVQPWSVVGVLSGNYQVKAELITPQGVVYGSATASFVVQASQALLNSARISADRVSYSAAQSVQLTSRVTNASSNTVQDNVTAVTQVFNSAGQSQFNQSEPIAQLTPNGQRAYSYSLPASTLPAGSYQARVQLLSAQGSVLAQSTTSFAVLSTDQTGIGLRGQLQATPSVVLIGQNVALNLQVNNNGNAVLTNLPVTIRVLDPQTGTVLATYTQTLASLNAGQSLPMNATWTSSGLDGQILVAAATANLNGRDIALAQAQIRLQGLAQLSVSPSQLNFGTVTLGGASAVSQIVTVRSIGSAPVQSLSFALSEVDATAFTIQGGTCIPGMPLAIGASCTLSIGYQPAQSKTHVATLKVGHAAAGNIPENVSLQGQAVQTQTVTLQSQPLVPKDARILVLASCQQSSNTDGHEEHDDDEDDDHRTSRGNSCSPQPQQANCTSARALAIGQYLDGLGILNKVVTDEASFRHEMRCGGYNTYWLSGGASKLEHYLVKEVREAVWRGDGLIIDGQHDDRNLLLDATAGVKYRGKLPGTNYSASIPAGSAFAQGGAASTLATLGQPAKYDLLTGQVQARFTASNSTVPAIVSNRYGAGNAMLFAFDLAAMVTKDIQQTATINLPLQHIVSTTASQVGSSMQNTTVTTNVGQALTIGDIQAQGISLSNPSNQTVTGQVTISLPAQLTYSSASLIPASSMAGTAVIPAQVNWLVTLAPQQSQQLIWRVKVQSVATARATYTVPVQVFSAGQGTATSSQLQATYSFSINAIAGSALIAKAIPAVQALQPVPAAERNAKTRAIAAITSATSLHNQARYSEAMVQWINTANELMSLTSLNSSSANSATQAAYTAARTAVALALEASTDGQCQALACLRGDLVFGSVTPVVGSTLNISRAVTNSCPAQLKDIPVTANMTNRRNGQTVLSLWDNLTIPVSQTNTRNAAWQVQGPQQGGQNVVGDWIDGILTADWQGHHIELDTASAQIMPQAIPSCPAGGSVSTSRFTPFAEAERLDVRSGKPGSADWEWGLGSNTQAAGQFAQANLDWQSATSYYWTVSTDAQGKGTFTVRNGANIVAQASYDKPAAKLKNGNAIRLTVKTAVDAGSAKIAASLLKIEGQSVNHSVTTTAANQSNSVVITHPGLTNGMSAEGTVRLDFTGRAPPQGSRLNFTLNAGTVQCP
jgi:hypothetical protein